MKECISCGQVFQGTDWLCPGCGFRPLMMNGRLAFAPEMAEKSDGFKSAYFDHLYELEGKNFWFLSRNTLILYMLKKYFSPFSSFLEIGCGTGFVLSAIEKEFPQLRLMGSEVYINGLSYTAKRISKGELFQMDARSIPFRDEFEVIGAFDVLEHIKDDEEILRQIHKTLKPGGGIIISVPQHKALWSYVDDYSHHVRRYSRSELREKAERNGFRVIRITSFVTMLLPLLFLSRKRAHDNSMSFDPTRELKISRWKNKILEQVMAIDQILIRMGINLPVGGSLLMIAQKH